MNSEIRRNNAELQEKDLLTEIAQVCPAGEGRCLWRSGPDRLVMGSASSGLSASGSGGPGSVRAPLCFRSGTKAVGAVEKPDTWLFVRWAPPERPLHLCRLRKSGPTRASWHGDALFVH
ncbi:hypothetical protein EYF80_057499 [Liparis tanakae]|uniref:Uncharacterized protein n=1 Tax=Liparis tanakae TaxID=230148 RepID=A0A4Z2EVF9_9TELE|nr:hypothetical protein EYF80_057499 [Liparis tanakae]